MAFQEKNFVQQHGYASQSAAQLNMWKYDAQADLEATVEAVGYFNDVADRLALNDIMYLVMAAGAANGLYYVSNIAAGVVTISGFATIGAGGVGTAQIDDLAVTGAKIDNATIADGKMVANTLTSASIATSVIQYVKVPVTAAQINGAYAAPFVLIAAPGANKLIVIESAMLEVDYGSAQFTGGGVLALQYDNTANGAGTIASSTLAAATVQGWAADSTALLTGVQASAAASTTSNKGIYLSNLTGAFAVGTGTTVDFHIGYRIVTTTL